MTPCTLEKTELKKIWYVKFGRKEASRPLDLFCLLLLLTKKCLLVFYSMSNIDYGFKCVPKLSSHFQTMAVFINLTRVTHQQSTLPAQIVLGKIMIQFCDQFLVCQPMIEIEMMY